MSEQPTGNGRLTVSEERLRLLLAEFKLDLVREFEKYVTQVAFNTLAVQVADHEKRLRDTEDLAAEARGVSRNQKAVDGRTMTWITVGVMLVSGVVSAIATLVWLAVGG